jgi:hypothetical protein
MNPVGTFALHQQGPLTLGRHPLPGVMLERARPQTVGPAEPVRG